VNEDLRRRYVRDLVADLEQVGGPRLEQWIRPLWDHLAGAPVSARGINIEGAPVVGALDAIWPDGSASEASSDASYFVKPYNKARHDIRNVLAKAPHVRCIRLFCSRSAGPKATNFVERAKSRAQRRGYTLDVWDGRRIAEYIVDVLLTDERFVLRVGTALPNLRRISEQNAASQRLPKLDARYAGRQEEEEAVVHSLIGRKCVVVSGFGGIGKTELACAVGHRMRDRFELVIWVDAAGVSRVEDLSAYDVRLNGYKLNILHLLSAHATLLILDNIGADIDTNAITSACGPASRVVITSRVAFGENVLPVGFLSRAGAHQMLSTGAEIACPEEVLDVVLQTVDGYPLALRMLNRMAVQGHDWSKVAQQCKHIVGAPDEKRRTLATRILEEHRPVLGRELAIFAWCDTASVDRNLFEDLFGEVGIEKLQRWALTARGQSDAVRLHDVVYASVKHLFEPNPSESAKLESQLEDFLRAQITPRRLAFFRIANRHQDLIERLLTSTPRPGILRYAYIHGRPAKRLSPALIGDPAQDAAKGPDRHTRAWLLSVVEAIEADYRRLRDLGASDAARTALEARLQTFESLIKDERLDVEERAIARHHRAKSLLKLRRESDALRDFEGLLAEGGASHATVLQVARLLSKDPERAKNLVFSIIETEKIRPGTVSTTVLLETLATLRRQHLRKFVSEMTERFGRFMAQQIKAAACSGADQPIRAFAAVGTEWSYKEPDLFMEVLEELDLGSPEEADDDDERVAVGRLLTAAGKMLQRQSKLADAQLRFEQSASFFAKVRNRSGFTCTQYGDVLLRLDRPEDAARVLDEAPEQQREEFWLLRRSEAHLQLGEHEAALSSIDKALASPKLAERRPTFIAQRAAVLFDLDDPSYEVELREAIRTCKDDQYRADLESKLQQKARPTTA
jgi:tetratricopeptide (TPR) repeat protein